MVHEQVASKCISTPVRTAEARLLPIVDRLKPEADEETRNAAILLLLLGVVFVIGGFGEIVAPDQVTAPRVVLVVGGLIAAIGGIALASLSGAALVERFRRGA